MAVRQEDLENTYQSYRQSAAQEDLLNLVQAGERLVRHFTRIYTGGLAEDALQSGREGLLKAIRRFDPDKQVAFCYLCFPLHYGRFDIIYGGGFLLPAGSQLRICRTGWTVMQSRLSKRGRTAGVRRDSEALNVKVEGVVQAMRAGLVSLDEVDIKKIQSLRYESFKLPIEDKLLLQQALARLTDLQRKVIYYLFFLDLTQTQTGKKLGLSQRAVSRVLHKSLQKMAEVFKL